MVKNCQEVFEEQLSSSDSFSSSLDIFVLYFFFIKARWIFFLVNYLSLHKNKTFCQNSGDQEKVFELTIKLKSLIMWYTSDNNI